MDKLAGKCIHPEAIIAGFVFYFASKSKYSETCASSTIHNYYKVYWKLPGCLILCKTVLWKYRFTYEKNWKVISCIKRYISFLN